MRPNVAVLEKGRRIPFPRNALFGRFRCLILIRTRHPRQEHKSGAGKRNYGTGTVSESESERTPVQTKPVPLPAFKSRRPPAMRIGGTQRNKLILSVNSIRHRPITK